MREIDSAGRCFPQKEWILLRSEAQVEIKLYEKEDFMSRTEELCLETAMERTGWVEAGVETATEFGREKTQHGSGSSI
jgi:hypothetical protein